MRVAVMIVVGAIVVLAVRWSSELQQPDSRSEASSGSRPPVAAARDAAVPPPTSKLAVAPTADAGAGRASERSPTASGPISGGGAVAILEDRTRTHAEGRSTLGPTQAAPVDRAVPEEKKSEREQGRLTFEGSFGYTRAMESAPAVRGRAMLAGSLDCQLGTGSLYYRDRAQRVEWHSSEFTFDAASVCYTEPDHLAVLASRFNASMVGTYYPTSYDPNSAERPEGNLALRITSTDPAGNPLPLVLFCFVLQGGVFGEYQLPQASGNAGTMPGCVLLDSFSIARGK